MKNLGATKRVLIALLTAAVIMPCFGCTDKTDDSACLSTAPDTRRAPDDKSSESEGDFTETETDECTNTLTETDKNGSVHTYAKPVIYLYPEEELVCSVRLTYDGKLTTTYPEYGADGWQNVTAHPDGRLEYNGREYYCLYWEGISDKLPEIKAGACVRGIDTAEYLELTLARLGLTEREANEFIIYWLPQLECNEYNIISFIGEEYTDIAKLDITPAPDSILRVYMLARPSDEYIELPAQSFAPFTREGFCVVEWGGTVLDPRGF